MPVTKRMSQEEKRVVILGIYHKSQLVYTEKEIFALVAKAGVSVNSIPDIHQSLIDDGLVEKEKIGGSNYFWSFPDKKDWVAQCKHLETLNNIETFQTKLEDAKARLADAKRGREDAEDIDETQSRASKLARLSELGVRKKALLKELDALKENDPAALADLEKEYMLVKSAAHRWTDNIFECKSYLVKKRGMDKKEANRILGITGNFDYPED